LRETTFASGVAEAWPADGYARGESWTACEEAVMAADVEVGARGVELDAFDGDVTKVMAMVPRT
jgi:hypothetical protein